jgi:plastocyanin
MNPLRTRFEYFLDTYKKPITIGVAALCTVLCALYLIDANMRAAITAPHENAPTLAESIRRGDAPIPEYSPSTAAKLAEHPVFHALISYTDQGFEPKHVTIEQGDIVRFTNNSSTNLWIAAEGREVRIYPRMGDTCGSSSLDACEQVLPQDFWQFAFDVKGEWHVTNNLDKTKSVVVIVQ